MKAIAIEVSEDRGVVELRPSWLARWLGARVTRVTVRLDRTIWRTWPCCEPVTHVKYGSLILHALDFRPVDPIPGARIIP